MTSAKSSQNQANTGLRAAQEPPSGWTPEADKDRQWQTLAALLRQDDEPEMPGEARWEEMRANIWREAGIGEAAPVVPIADESLARPRYTARLMQIAAVGVAAFALGWVLSPTGSSPEAASQIAFLPAESQESADPEKEVHAPGGMPERVTPIRSGDSLAVPVSSDSAPGATPRQVVIREGGDAPAIVSDSAPNDLLPQFIRTLRAQPGQTVSADAILKSIDTLLGEDPAASVEASLRYLKAEVLLLEKRDSRAAGAEYEAVLALTNDEGPLAENARSRLASLR